MIAVMFRALRVATLVAVLPAVSSGQELAVLRITVTLNDAARAAVPIPRAALLISDNPATSTPRRVVTKADGTAVVHLRPGNYTVESDEPVVFDGKAYEWTQTLDVTAGRDVVLDLTAANAEVGPAPAPSSSPASASSGNESAAARLLAQWQDSVVAVWTPESRASGFVVDEKGMVVTTQRALGSASAIDVQLTPAIKVGARVLAADRAHDVAILWIDPAAAASVTSIPLQCPALATPPIGGGRNLIAIGAPLRGPKAATIDLRVESASVGGPVFSADGALAGLSSSAEGGDDRRRADVRVVPVVDVCELMAAAEKAMRTASRPNATRLPVEPLRPFPSDALDAAVKNRQGALSPYLLSASGFDVAFLTPVTIRGAQQAAQQRSARGTAMQQRREIDPTDFGDWSEYFADVPPVLVVRVTPKLTEGFWTTFARGAAYTQGMAIPPIKHFKPGFLRLRAMCGEVEVVPIHPFTLTQRVSDTDAVREGVFVFEPQAFGPHCATVRLILYSEKEPGKPETRVVDPGVVDRIWQDFSGYRQSLQ